MPFKLAEKHKDETFEEIYEKLKEASIQTILKDILIGISVEAPLYKDVPEGRVRLELTEAHYRAICKRFEELEDVTDMGGGW